MGMCDPLNRSTGVWLPRCQVDGLASVAARPPAAGVGRHDGLGGCWGTHGLVVGPEAVPECRPG